MDSHDLDDELLALAGEGDEQPSSPASEHSATPHEEAVPGEASESPIAAAKSSSEAKESPAPMPAPKDDKKSSPAADPKSTANAAQKGVARKMNKRTAANRPKLTIESDQDEPSSGPATPVSEGSAAMDESEDETSAAAAAEGTAESTNKYPVEGKFLSQLDKLKIMSLPESHREEILAKRAQTAYEDEFRGRLLQRHKEEENAKKRFARRSRGKSEEVQRKNQYVLQKTLESYREKREQRNEIRRRDDDRRAEGRSLSARGSSSPESNASQTDHMRPDGNIPIDLGDANRIRVGRSDLTAIGFTPGFEAFAAGSFIRVAKGPDATTGEMRYEAYLVAKVTTGKPYTITTPSENAFRTDQYFAVAANNAGGPFPFTHCSNAPITASEWQLLKEQIVRTRHFVPNRSMFDHKLAQLVALRNYRWTDKEITAKLKRAHAIRSRLANQEIEDAVRRRDNAVASGNEAAAKAEQEIIDRHNDVAHLPPAPKAKVPDENALLAQRLAAVNREIRKSNMETARPKPKPKARPAKRASDDEAAGGASASRPVAKKPKTMTDDEYATMVAQSIDVDIEI